MKSLYVWLIVIGVSVSVLIAGELFIFGIGSLSEDDGSFFEENSYVDDSEEVSLSDEEQVVSSEGAGGGSGGASGGEAGAGFVCSKWQPVQYSLGEFDENIECLVYGVGVCNRVKASCGVEVFNLDYDIEGIFGIRFSLFSGDDEIAFEVVDADVGAREREALDAEIFLDGEFDVGSLKCVIDSDRVPRECLG